MNKQERQQYNKNYYRKNKERLKQQHKEYYYENREKFKEWRKQRQLKYPNYMEEWNIENPDYMKTYRKINKEKIDKINEEYRKSNLEKVKAHNDLNHAIEKGKIIRPDRCSKCKRECKPEGHHEDYDKPLDVVWLCRSCHRKKYPLMKKLNKFLKQSKNCGADKK